MSNIINGKQIANEIKEKIKNDINASKIRPGLAVIMVGDNPASQIYINSKAKAANELGIKSDIRIMPECTKQNELIDIIGRLNDDKTIHGILVQLPLPKHINEYDIFCEISPKKDVDGLNPSNMGVFFLGIQPNFYPCTPSGIMELIKSTGIEIKGANAVVIGRSNIVGKPIAHMLMKEDATVTICHSKTKDIKFFTKQADILVAALGKPKFITKDMVKIGAVIIDVGINRVGGKIFGDVDFENVKDMAGYITPVPGGVGPMTIAMLMMNCLKAAKLSA